MNSTIPAEQWRPIPGFEPFEASDAGRIREDLGNGEYRPVSCRRYPSYAYVMCSLKKYGSRGVHRLVALAFHGEPPAAGLYACHNDENPENNRPENLRWDTPRGNTGDSIRNGTHVSVVERRRGEARRAAKAATDAR